MKTRREFVTIFLILSAFATGLQALDPVNTNWRGLAIKGYDPVAYFTQGAPVAGDAEFATEWRGATWRFSSAENRDRFTADPERYAPQYGGYCAWAVSQGYTASIDPEAWRIVDGRLFLNYSRDVQAKWEQAMADNIKHADVNWPKLRDS